MDVIVDTINQFAPTTNWVHVMEDDGFNIPDESALNLMMSIYTRACKETVPIHAVCWSLWKNTEGQNCLVRFVDMCQELKILSAVLDCTPLPFSIKLATAASRKDHSLIDKWLIAKSDVYKAGFLEECVSFLKEIMSSTPMEQPQAEVMNMCWGSFPLFVEVCQSHSGEHSTVRSGTIRNKLEEQVREMTLKYLLQPNSLDIIENGIDMLLKDRQVSKDLIFEEKQKVFELTGSRFEYPFAGCNPLFDEEYGPVIRRLKTLTNSNDETLKYLRKVLCKYLNGDALLCQVDDIFKRNKVASKRVCPLIIWYYDYLRRANIEFSWFVGAEHRVDRIYGLLSGGATVLAELEELESHICDLNRRVALLSEKRSLLSKECTQNFHSHCQDLDTVAKLYEDIGILSKKLLLVTKAAEDLCLTSKDFRILLSEKTMYATRFHYTMQYLKEEKESSEMYQELLDLQIEVDQARISCKKKMHGLPKVSDPVKEFEQILVDKAMSWRTRRLVKKNILGEMRVQGLNMCAFVSTVVMRESLGKREDALNRLRFGGRYMPNGCDIKLSEDHLQDSVRVFCATNKRRGDEKLDVCLERMIETGVVSERAYNVADERLLLQNLKTWFKRYCISKFDKMEPSHIGEAFRKLDDAVVLIGTFGITKEYFSLGPDDVYDVPEDAVLETNAAGNKLTHAVVLVGYDKSPQGEPYYGFQNWNGPGWGKGGFGMVTCRSIRQLYSAEL